jgi:hypothetical protein
VFDAASLRVLEELYDSTWQILQAQHPFRDVTKDIDLRDQLRRKLFILAEQFDLNVSPQTIVRFERGEKLRPRTVTSLRRVLDAAGIEFLDGRKPGIRLSSVARA